MKTITSTFKPLRRTIKGRKISIFTDGYIDEKCLPHGSGINGPWEVILKKDRATCYNTFDHMNENGMYDAEIDFSVTFRMNGEVSVRFHGLNSKGRRFVENDGLRDYLEETLAESWEPIAKELDWK